MSLIERTVFLCLCYFFVSQIPVSVCDACGVYEESTTATLTCKTFEGKFSSFGPRLEIDGDGTYHETVSCDSNGDCDSVDPTRYTYLRDYPGDEWSVSVVIAEVNRTMTSLQCYKEGAPLLGAACDIHTYVKPEKPTCEAHVFENDGTEVVYYCRSGRVFPMASCRFEAQSADGLVDGQLFEHLTRPPDSEGDYVLVCEYHLTVTGASSGTYVIYMYVLTYVNGSPIDSASVQADPLTPLVLAKTALHNPDDNGHVFEYPDNDILSLQIPITGTPQPNTFSLKVRYDESSEEVTLHSNQYTILYTVGTGSVDGVISLNVSGGLDRTRKSSFTFKADNGVVGGTELMYTFSVESLGQCASHLLACGVSEENSYQSFTCSTTCKKFTSYGPWIQIDGAFQKLGSCNDEGVCETVDRNRFNAAFSTNGDNLEVKLEIDAINRTMGKVRCYMDDQAFFGDDCDTAVYVKSTKPSCTGPSIINGKAVYTCSADGVYPAGRCEMSITEGDPNGLADTTVTAENLASSQYAGNQFVTCQAEIAITGSTAGVYKFKVSVTPDVVGVPDSASVPSDVLPALSLSPVTLNGDSGSIYNYPEGDDLAILFPWTGNPPPDASSFMLSVRYDTVSGYTPIGSIYYTAYIYGDDDIKVVIEKDAHDTARESYFRFTATNGVAGDQLEYTFTVRAETTGADPGGNSGDGDSGGGDNLPIIIGLAVAGGVIVIVIVAVCVVVRSRKSSTANNENSTYNKAYDSSEQDPHYLYPLDLGPNLPRYDAPAIPLDTPPQVPGTTPPQFLRNHTSDEEYQQARNSSGLYFQPDNNLYEQAFHGDSNNYDTIIETPD